MKMSTAPVKKLSTVEEYQLEHRFQRLQAMLLDEKNSSRLDKTLAYWALPTDRRLPLAFLGWELRELLATPFNDLLATPGIGHKKIASLMILLARATEDDPPGANAAADTSANKRVVSAPARRGPENGFDADAVSEALWAQWCATVVQHGIEHLVLGRLAPTLEALPTVIWDTPLSYYLNRSTAEIRRLKTYGEKRVRVVFEIFSLVHQTFEGVRLQSYHNLRLVPKFVQPIEQWVAETLVAPGPPCEDDMSLRLVGPIVNQVRVDLGETVAKLVSDRLGLNGPPLSVRKQAREMGVTRARVYQLLEDCSKMMGVRWPEGQWQLAALERKLDADSPQPEQAQQIDTLRDIFYSRNSTSIDDRNPPQEMKMVSDREPVLAL